MASLSGRTQTRCRDSHYDDLIRTMNGATTRAATTRHAPDDHRRTVTTRYHGATHIGSAGKALVSG